MKELARMLEQHRLGFHLTETMSGTHEFVNKAGPDGEHPMKFTVTWGTKHLSEWLNPLSHQFMSNYLQGHISVGALVDDAPCHGTLDLRYFQEAALRYTIFFKGDDGTAYKYVGEKVNLRPWNLHRTHTTCYGTITNLNSNVEISRSILHFRLDTAPSFLASFRLG